MLKSRLITNAAEWNRSILELPATHILQSWEWGAFKAKYGWTPTRILLCDGDKPRAAAQVLRRPLPRQRNLALETLAARDRPLSDAYAKQVVNDLMSTEEQEVKALCAKWGADVVRDSDGTTLSPELLELGLGVYSTICLIRADQEWAKADPTRCQQKYLISRPVTCSAISRISASKSCLRWSPMFLMRVTITSNSAALTSP